jgi:hypothetical protein
MRLGVAAILVLALSVAVRADDIVFRTDFEGASQQRGSGGGPVMHGGEESGGFTASVFTKGAGIRRMRVDRSVPGDLFLSEQADNPNRTFEEAMAADSYFELTVSAPAAADFTKLAFTLRGFGTKDKGYITVRSNVDGYAADLATVEGPMNAKNRHPVDIDLSSKPGYTDRGDVTFRFYVYGDLNRLPNRRIGIDDVQVTARLSAAAADGGAAVSGPEASEPEAVAPEPTE